MLRRDAEPRLLALVAFAVSVVAAALTLVLPVSEADGVPPAVPGADFLDVDSSGTPARLACGDIAIIYDATGAPYDALADLQIAARDLGAAMGRAVTVSVSGHDADDEGPRVEVRWVATSLELGGNGRTVGSTTSVVTDAVIADASILLAADGIVDPGAGGSSWQAVLRHELGHAAGLAHSAGPGSVMTPSIDPSHDGTFGPSDRSGLAVLGSHCPS